MNILTFYLWGLLASFILLILVEIYEYFTKKKHFVLKVNDLSYYFIFTVLSWIGMLFIFFYFLVDVLNSIPNKTILTIKHKH